MSVAAITVFELRCDECGAKYTWEEFETDAIWNSLADVEAFVAEWWLTAEHSHEVWSTDGEGRVWCAAHEPLAITQAARDEAARRPGPDDVPLIEVLP